MCSFQCNFVFQASAHMQEQLASLADEMEHMDTVSWSAVARFVHCQVVQHARDCLQKALSGLVTCRYFYEMTENLSKLVEDVSNYSLIPFIFKYLYYPVVVIQDLYLMSFRSCLYLTPCLERFLPSLAFRL